MKSYCVRERRETECVPGTEQRKTAINGRLMLQCKCASCGIIKTKFLSGKNSLRNIGAMLRQKGDRIQSGGATDGEYTCGLTLKKGQRYGTVKECFNRGQVRRYGKKIADDLDILMVDRDWERKEAAKQRRIAKKKPSVWTKEKQKQYVDEIVADIKKETAEKRRMENNWKIPVGYKPKLMEGIEKKTAKSRKPALNVPTKEHERPVKKTFITTTKKLPTKAVTEKILNDYYENGPDPKIIDQYMKKLSVLEKKPIGSKVEIDGYTITKFNDFD